MYSINPKSKITKTLQKLETNTSNNIKTVSQPKKNPINSSLKNSELVNLKSRSTAPKTLVPLTKKGTEQTKSTKLNPKPISNNINFNLNNQSSSLENNPGTTIIGKVKDIDNPNQEIVMKFNVKTTKADDPLEFYSQLYKNNNNNTKLKSVDSSPFEHKIQQDFLLNTIKSNKLTFGTMQMMNNERLHAQEAIESGIYITWTTKGVYYLL